MVTIYQTGPLDRAAIRTALITIEAAIPPAFFPRVFGIPVPISDTEIDMRLHLADQHGSVATFLAAHAIGAVAVEEDLIDASSWFSYGALADWSGKTTRAPVGVNH